MVFVTKFQEVRNDTKNSVCLVTLSYSAQRDRYQLLYAAVISDMFLHVITVHLLT